MTPPIRSYPLIVAHRGASASAPENTLAAFTLAVAQDADGIEVDVRRTADDVLVLHHDPMLPDGSPIVERTFSEIRAVMSGIATLDDLLGVAGDLLINIEIKNAVDEPDYDPERRVADAVVAWVLHHQLTWRTVVTSFDPDMVDRIRSVDSTSAIVTGQLTTSTDDPERTLRDIAARRHSWVAPSHRSLDPDPGLFVSAAHDLGLEVMVWTVDDPARIRKLSAAGVDAVITNDPASANDALG